MDGAETGFKPGWVVTYAPRSRNYGTAFFVSLFGKVQARGTPFIVTTQRIEANEGIEKFRKAFAQVDSAVEVGSAYSRAVAILGQPITTFTNDNGLIQVHFSYTPKAMGHVAVDWLTNGFTLLVSNDIIVRKGYSYTSSR